MDNFKLMKITLICLIAFWLPQMCSYKANIKPNGFKDWTDSTKTFMEKECDSYQVLTDTLEVGFRYNNDKIFKRLLDYVSYRLQFRDTIEAILDKATSLEGFQRARVVEYYNEKSSKARIIFEMKNQGEKVQNSLISLNHKNISIEVTSGLEDENYSEKPCIIAAKYSMATKFTIVTDLSKNGLYTTRFVSFY